MIKQVLLNNFKGRTEVVDLGKYNLLHGPMGSGKSAVPEALVLAITGYVKGVKRRNQEIYHTMFSDNEDPFAPVEHSVGFVFKAKDGEIEFKRGFEADKSGSIAQVYSVNEKKVSKDKYREAMTVHRIPGIFDIEEFVEFSDDKKINAIFERFGDTDDIEIDSKIDNSKAEISRLNDLVKTNKAVAQKLSVSRAELELPAGSLAEVNNEIQKAEAEIKLASQHLTKLKIEEAKQKKEDEMIKKAEEAKQAAQEIFGDDDKKADPGDEKSAPTNALDVIDDQMQNTEKKQQDFANRQIFGNGFKLSPRDSIQKIINAIKSVGCAMCSNGAGVMVAKQELSKYEVDHETD